jgi:hypothetical protein
MAALGVVQRESVCRLSEERSLYEQFCLRKFGNHGETEVASGSTGDRKSNSSADAGPQEEQRLPDP